MSTTELAQLLSSSAGDSVARAVALAIFLGGSVLTSDELGARARWTSGTDTSSVTVTTAGSADLVSALTFLHERLLRSSTELHVEAKAVLYGNLWELYSG